MTKNTPVFFPNLDGLRYIACMAVFVQHAFSLELEPYFPHSYLLNKLANFIFWGGATGVSFFFVLSGFLITYLLLKEEQNNGKIDVAAFYVRRSLRIWPLFYALVLYSFLVFYGPGAGFNNLSPEKWKYLYFASNFACMQPMGCMHPVNITWSVSIEEQFYLVWPLLFFFIPRRLYAWVCPSVMLISIYFRMSHISEAEWLYFHTFSMMYDLALGGFCAYAALHRPAFSRFFANNPAYLRIALYLAGLAILIFGRSIWPSEQAYIIGQRLLNTAFFAYVIMDQNYSHYTWWKMSNMRFMSRWGKYTYGLYLLHPVLYGYVDLWLRPYTEGMPHVWEVILIGLLAAVFIHLCCYLSYHFFEMPFLKLKARFSRVQS